MQHISFLCCSNFNVSLKCDIGEQRKSELMSPLVYYSFKSAKICDSHYITIGSATINVVVIASAFVLANIEKSGMLIFRYCHIGKCSNTARFRVQSYLM